MITREINTLVINISPARDKLMHEMVMRNLIHLGDIDISLLVFMSLNELTINRTISPGLTMNIDALCSHHLSHLNIEQQQQVVQVCMQIAAMLYSDYNTLMETARLNLPAKLISVRYSDGTVAMVFECTKDQS